MRIFLILFLTTFPFFLHSQDNANEKKIAKYVMENIQKDYVDCYSFYKVAAETFRSAGKEKSLTENLEKSADVTLKFNYDLGEVLNLKPKYMAQTTKAEVKKFTKIAQNDFQILAKKYGLMCKKLVENQKQRIDYWEEKGNKKIK